MKREIYLSQCFDLCGLPRFRLDFSSRLILCGLSEKKQKAFTVNTVMPFLKWAQMGLNQRPPDYESYAYTIGRKKFLSFFFSSIPLSIYGANFWSKKL